MVETSSLNAFRLTGSGALGGTRTPNLLIRSWSAVVLCVRWACNGADFLPLCALGPWRVVWFGYTAGYTRRLCPIWWETCVDAGM
jgi:hypothetical protein